MSRRVQSPLTDAHAVRFIARLSQADIDDYGRFRGPLIQGQKLQVHALRPASLRIEDITNAADLDPSAPFGGFPWDYFVSDGKSQYEMSRSMRQIVQASAASALEEIRSSHGLPEHIGVDLLFSPDFRGGVAVHKCASNQVVYSRRSVLYGDELEEKLVCDPRCGLPLRLVRSLNEGQVIWRVDYCEWELNPPMADDLFNTTPPSDAIPEPDPEPAHSPALSPGQFPAPFTAIDLDSSQVTLQNYRGRVLLLDYWAMWCAPCREERIELARAYLRYGERGFDILSVSLDPPEARDELKEYAKRTGMVWPIVHDSLMFDSPLVTPYAIQAIPFNLLIGRDGRIAAINKRGSELDRVIRREIRRAPSRLRLFRS